MELRIWLKVKAAAFSASESGWFLGGRTDGAATSCCERGWKSWCGRDKDIQRGSEKLVGHVWNFLWDLVQARDVVLIPVKTVESEVQSKCTTFTAGLSSEVNSNGDLTWGSRCYLTPPEKSNHFSPML